MIYIVFHLKSIKLFKIMENTVDVDFWHVDLEECYSKEGTIAQQISFDPDYLQTELAKDLNMCCGKLDPNLSRNLIYDLMDFEVEPVDARTSLKNDYMLSQVSNDLEACSEMINENILNDSKYFEDFKVNDDNVYDVEMESSLSSTPVTMMQQVRFFS